jgi:hypothetical protein
MDRSISQIRKAVEYWVSMVQEPWWKIQERWGECNKSWENINREMEKIELPKFSPPENFTDLHDIVKRHVGKDSTWEANISHISSMTPGKLKNYVEHPIKSLIVLQCLSVNIIMYRERAVEIKEVFSTPMNKNRFPFGKTCEDLFFKWAEYEINHPPK